MNIDTLLQAAEYLDRRDREAEHGYASNAPVSDYPKNYRKKPKTKKTQGSRTTHNELEKNRRAHLRNCLEKLKELVPLGPEASRHTTLGLLTKAESYIRNLEDAYRRLRLLLEKLQREKRYLRRKLKTLQNHSHSHSHSHSSLLKRRSLCKCSPPPQPLSAPTPSSLSLPLPLPLSLSLSHRRSLSESSANTVCSLSTNLSTGSPSISESDEVDVIGYTSNHSDTDDHSSVQSSSDSGVAMSTSRLTLSEMEII